MGKRVKMFVLTLLLLLCGSALSKEKKVQFFPILSFESEISLSLQFTDFLKEKLLKTEIFELYIKEDFQYALQDNRNIFESVKKSVLDNKDSNFQSVIFGYILKQGQAFIIQVYLYSTIENNIVADYTDRIFSAGELENSAKYCAIEFASRLYNIEGSRIYVGALMMPGLGHMMMKKYLRGAFFLGGFVYFMSKNFSTEIPQAMEYRDFRSYLSGSGRIYTVNGKEVSYAQWINLKEEYDNYVTSYNDLKAKKRNFQLGAALVYLLNVVDTMILTKKYNSKMSIEKKLSLDVEPFSYIPTVSLNYRF